MGHLGNVAESKPEKGTKEAIAGSKSLIRGERMGSTSAGNPEISGSLTDSITKTLRYGEQGKSDTDWRIGKTKTALSDFAKQAKNKNQRGEKQYKERRIEIQEKLKKLEIRGNNNNSPCG